MFVVFLFFFALIAGTVYENSKTLDSFSNFVFKWTSYNSTCLKISISATSSGWIAIGFSPYVSSMAGDMVIGWMSGSKPTLNSYQASGTVTPTFVQAVSPVSSSNTNGVLSFEFLFPLSVGIDMKGTQPVIWAIGSSIPSSSILTSNDKHSRKGNIGLILCPTCPNDGPTKPNYFLVTSWTTNSVTLSWSVPSSQGTSAITGYTVEMNNPNNQYSVAYEGTATTATINSLVSGFTYTFKVYASNSKATSPYSFRNYTAGSAPIEWIIPSDYTSSTSVRSGTIYSRVVPGTDSNPVVEFAIDFKSFGYVALGIGNDGMNRADIAAGYVTPDQMVSVSDYWSTSEVTPISDTMNNILGYVGYEDPSGYTRIKFQRYANTGDTAQDKIIRLDEFTGFIFATHSTSDSLVQHNREGDFTMKVNSGPSGSSQLLTIPTAFPLYQYPEIITSSPSSSEIISNLSNNGSAQTFDPSKYSHVNNDISDYIVFARKVSEINSSSLVEFALDVNTCGWIGIGFCDDTFQMQNADIVMIAVSGSSVSYGDFFATGEEAPTSDSDLGGTNDIVIMNAYCNQTTGRTLAIFRRPAISGDPNDRNIDLNSDLNLIWAYNPSFSDFTDQHPLLTRGGMILSAPLSSNSSQVLTGSTTINPSDYEIKITDNPDFLIYVKKSSSYSDSNKEYEFALDVNGLGYVGIGISDEKLLMEHSDIVIGKVKANNVQINDYYAFGNVQPLLDTSLGGSNDVIPLAGWQENGRTKIKFKKKGDSTDQYDRTFDFSKTVYLIFAWHLTSTELVVHHFYDQYLFTPKSNNNTGTTGTSYDIAGYSTKFIQDPNFLIYGRIIKENGSDPIAEFMLDVNAQGWVAIGFGSLSMTNADMIVATVDNSQLTVHDYWSTGEVTPQLDTSIGGTDDVIGISGKKENGRVVVVFRRPVKANGKGDVDISIDNSNQIIYAFHPSSNDFVQHPRSNTGTLLLPMNGTATIVIQDDLTYPAHGLILGITWVLLVPGTVLIARYYKDIGHNWFLIHQYGNALAIFLTFLMVLLVIAKKYPGNNFSDPDTTVATHGVFGIIIFVGCILQGVLGKLADIWWNPNRNGIPVFPDRMHWWFGRALTFIAVINVGLGVYCYEGKANSWWFYGIALAILVVSTSIISQKKIKEHEPTGVSST